MAAFGLVLLAGAPVSAAPARVVSMNLCTDQLAQLIAAPGQLVSVSFLAHDPALSPLAEDARRLHRNRGLAEEVFLLEPDLVIVGRYTTRATVSMMDRLGLDVVAFEPAYTLADVRANLIRMGDVLDRPDRARALVAAFDREIAALERARPEDGGRAVSVSLNSFTAGAGSLAGAVIAASGLTNIGEEMGITGSGRVPLEVLVLSRPDLLILGRRHADQPWQASEIYRHPALEAVAARTAHTRVDDRAWICGTPLVTEVVGRLQAIAHELARDADRGAERGSVRPSEDGER